MSVKEQLIEAIVSIQHLQGKSAEQTRTFLKAFNVAELEVKHNHLLQRIAVAPTAEVIQEQERAEEARQARDEEGLWLNILKTLMPGRGYIRDNQANRLAVFSWPHYDQGEVPTPAWLFKVFVENPSLANFVSFEPAATRDPVFQKKQSDQQLVKDKATFAQACRELSIGETEANFGQIRRVLGDGLSIYAIQQAVISGAVSVTPASPAELTAWNTEAIEQHNEFLMDADKKTLQRIANEEFVHRQPQSEIQANLDIQAQERRDSIRGFKPLPASIDRAAIKAATGEQFRKWSKIYGLTQLTERARQSA